MLIMITVPAQQGGTANFVVDLAAGLSSSMFDELVDASLDVLGCPSNPSERAAVVKRLNIRWEYDFPLGATGTTPSDKTGVVLVRVSSERTLSSFLALAMSGVLGSASQQVPQLRLRYDDASLDRGANPTLPPASTGNSFVPQSTRQKSSRPTGGDAAVAAEPQSEPAATVELTKVVSRPGFLGPSAPAPSTAPPQPLIPPASSPLTPNGEVPNHIRAQQLLASFAAPSAPVMAMVRTVLIDGSYSAEVAFDAYLPPDITELRRRIWQSFEGPLRRRWDELSAERSHEAPPVTAETFLLSFRPMDHAVASDLDDNRDVQLAASIGKERGEHTLLFIVEVPVFVDDDPYISPVTEGKLQSPQRGLGVNQVHTPRRSKKTETALADLTT